MKGVVVCAGGLRVAQRGAEKLLDRPGFLVGGVRSVTVPASAPVEARRSDNVVWRRHWVEEGRLVIDFVDIATVEVDEQRGTITFDQRLPDEMEQHLLLDHVLPLVMARRGEIVLHGAVISRDDKAVVLIGPSGAGKSTLTAFAWQQGWTVGGDDGAVLAPTRPPTVEPTYSTIRLKPTTIELLSLEPEPDSAVVGKMRIAGRGSRGFRQQKVELKVIASLHPAEEGDVARFDQLSGFEAHARLFKSTFHAELSAGRLLPGVVTALGHIVENTTVGQLSVPRGLDGLSAAESLLRSCVDSPDGYPHQSASSASA